MLLNRSIFVKPLLFVLCSSGCTTASSYAGCQEPVVKVLFTSAIDLKKKKTNLDFRLLRKSVANSSPECKKGHVFPAKE